ncbi:MAG: pilin [Microgenomates group bacterium]|nr:pilin [Microgenomates group bacterium]
MPFFNFVVYAQLKDWCPTPGAPDCCLVDGVPTLKCLEIVFNNILYLATGFIILVLFVMFVVGSFNYLTSLGNPEKVKKAQGTITYALVGFIIFIASYLILNIIDILFLGGHGNIFKFRLPD